MRVLHSKSIVIYAQMLVLFSYPASSALHLKDKEVSSSLVGCVKSAGFKFKGVTMLSDNLNISNLAEHFIQALETPVTIVPLGSDLNRGDVYVLFSPDTNCWEELLNNTNSVSEDTVTVIMLFHWRNQFKENETFTTISSVAWGHTFYRIFILVEQENSNVNVRGYVPYLESHCGRSGSPTLVDVWNSTKKEFTMNRFQLENLSSKEIHPKSFNGCSFKGIAINSPTEFTNSAPQNGMETLNKVPEGLLVSFMRSNNLTLSIKLVQDTFHGFYRDRDVYELIRKSLFQGLFTERFDAAFGHFPYTMISPPDCEFLLSYLNDKIEFVVPCGTEGKDSMWRNYYQEFSGPTWAGVGIVFVLLLYSLKLISRIFQGEASWLSSAGIHMLLFGVHLENSTTFKPSSNTMKLLLILVMFYTMVVSVAYKASLKSFLLAPLRSRSIETWEELERSGFKIRGGPVTYSILKETSVDQPILKKLLQNYQLHHTDNFSDVVHPSVKTPDTAFLFSESDTIHFMKSFKTDEKRKVWQNMCKVPRIIVSTPVTPVIVRKGSPLVTILNRAIIHNLQGGLLKAFGSPDIRPPTSSSGLHSERVAYRLEHLKGIFFLWLFGTITAVFVFSFEVLYFKLYFNDEVIVL